MPVVSKPKLDLIAGGPLPGGFDGPPPVVFRAERSGSPRRRPHALWDRVRGAMLAATIVAVVAGTFLALGYLFGEAILGG
jgi:hypothetical protein